VEGSDTTDDGFAAIGGESGYAAFEVVKDVGGVAFVEFGG
jgi:hypothetical protein